MESVKPESNSWWLDRHISPENCKWLGENIEGVDQSVKQMLKLIEEDENSSVRKAEVCYPKKLELIACVGEFSRLHQLLAERYDNLTGELRRFSDSASQQASPFQTPNPKLGQHKSEQPIGFDLFLSSGGASSDTSLKSDSESPSLSSDSDSESFNSSINKQESVNGTLKVIKTGGYEGLLRRISEYEEELKISNKKLQFSEEEIFRLKGKLEKKDSVISHLGNLQDQLDSAQRDIKAREANLEMEKKKVVELQKQVTELETRIFDSDCEIGTLGEELKITREKLRVSEEEIANLIEGTHQLQDQVESSHTDMVLLESKLDSEKRLVSEMQEQLLRYIADVSDRDCEIKEFNAALHNAQSEIYSLLKQKTLLGEKIGEWEFQSRSQENEIKQCKAEKIEMKGLLEAQEIKLKAEMDEKRELVDCLNKTLEILKLKYDVLMGEKKGVDAKVEKLQKEVDRQRNVISDRAEEKREAIRQLCFSLEHYRSGYQELRQAYMGHKRRAIFAW